MDFFDLVNKRRSVRKFSTEQVPEEVIIKSLIVFYKLPSLFHNLVLKNCPKIVPL